jgi:hypothetical protein
MGARSAWIGSWSADLRDQLIVLRAERPYFGNASYSDAGLDTPPQGKAPSLVLEGPEISCCTDQYTPFDPFDFLPT